LVENRRHQPDIKSSYFGRQSKSWTGYYKFTFWSKIEVIDCTFEITFWSTIEFIDCILQVRILVENQSQTLSYDKTVIVQQKKNHACVKDSFMYERKSPMDRTIKVEIKTNDTGTISINCILPFSFFSRY
jgi:hypothetical protein